MKHLIFIVLTILFIGCDADTSMEDLLMKDVEKVMLSKEGPTEFFYFELKDRPEIWASNPDNIAAIQSYRDSVQHQLGSSKYAQTVHKESVQDLDSDRLKNAVNGDSINALLVHTGKIGSIRDMNFLESCLLNYQVSRFPLFSTPTEFHGFILSHKKTGIIRVYFGASDTEWPPQPRIILKELTELDHNWKLIYHLHNHYCKEDGDYVGILAPSLADAQYFKMLKEQFSLEKAIITNGFHTVEIDSSDFEKFESH
ncbi:hypothetical protein KFE94_12550 [bacterium SCSIO 12643]|nr:hypothetical protein KFE94_12550 [bacterium SCSIO 12643]